MPVRKKRMGLSGHKILLLSDHQHLCQTSGFPIGRRKKLLNRRMVGRFDQRWRVSRLGFHWIGESPRPWVLDENREDAMSVLGRSIESTQEITLEGQVEILGDFRRGIFGDGRAVKHSGLILRTDSGRMIIHLGPLGYFMQHNFQIKAGDTLRVTGRRMEQNQVPLIMASEVRNDQQSLNLRERNGPYGNLPRAAGSLKVRTQGSPALGNYFNGSREG